MCITSEAAVDVDEAAWTLDEGAARHHGRVLVDLMHRGREPALLADCGLKPTTVPAESFDAINISFTCLFSFLAQLSDGFIIYHNRPTWII